MVAIASGNSGDFFKIALNFGTDNNHWFLIEQKLIYSAGEDDFTFSLSKEEFMQVFFEDLALPHLVRTQLLPDAVEWRTQRAGFVSAGNPASLHVVRSVRTALGRRIAMGGDLRHRLAELQAQGVNISEALFDNEVGGFTEAFDPNAEPGEIPADLLEESASDAE